MALTKQQRNLWRAAKRAKLQVLKVDKGWTWSINYGEYNGAWLTRSEAIREALSWYVVNYDA